MNEQDKEQLLQSLSEVLEGFAFMFVDEPVECDLNQYQSFFHASIGFHADPKPAQTRIDGRFEIIAPSQFAEEMANNILGADAEAVDPEMGRNALLELANVTCGHLLAQRYGSDWVFDLDIPKAQDLEIESACERFQGDDRYCVFDVDGTPVCVGLLFQQ